MVEPLNTAASPSPWLRRALAAGVILCALTLIVFAIIRTIETYGGVPPENLFQSRYVDHPLITAIHMLTGIAFVTLAPFQFNKNLRQKHRKAHRVLGRILLASALFAGLYGLLAASRFPAFGGISSLAASWFFGPMFLFSLVQAFRHIRKRRVALHREWMIRAFALGLGVGTQRIFIGLFAAFGGFSIGEVFGTSLWIGFALNLAIAEVWIQRTRITDGRSTP